MSRRAVLGVSQSVSGEIIGLAQLGVRSSVRDVACEGAAPDGKATRFRDTQTDWRSLDCV